MAEPKTKMTAASVSAFIAKVPDAGRRADCTALVKLMKKVTKKDPKMWGPSIIGFDTATIVYAGGREGKWPPIGFSPRKQDLTLYVAARHFPVLLAKLGKHKIGGGCLYIKRLADVDFKVLEQIIAATYKKRRSAAKG